MHGNTKIKFVNSAGFESRYLQEISLFSKSSDHLWGQPGLLFSECPGTVPGIRRSGRQVNHLPSSGAEVENKWSYSCTPPITFHGVESVNFSLSCFAVLGGWENCVIT